MLAAPVVLLCDGLICDQQSHAGAITATWLYVKTPAEHKRRLVLMFAFAGLRRLGMVMPDAVESAAAANAAWLEDVIEHLLCVLALDRFADYVSDQVSIFSTTG